MTNETPPQPAMTVEQARRLCAEVRPDYADGFLSGKYDDSSTEMQVALLALAQQSAATGGEVPSGFVLVPCEPTGDMVNAGVKAWLGLYEGRAPEWTDYLTRTWRAMLAAAPKPTHPNDMARENERLREAGNRLAAQTRSYQRGNSGRTDLGRALNAWDQAALSTTPNNPAAPSDARMRINRWLSDGVGYEKIDAAFRNDLRAALTNPAGDAEAIEAVVGRMSLDERVSALDLIQKKCTCFEVNGEDPDCLLHGEDTDWGRANPDIADDAALSANGGDAG